MNTSVIIIDNEPSIQKLLVRYLENKGMNILGIGANGQEAFELYKKFNPEVILLDIMMPVYDGIYALEKIKEYNQFAKIIVFTGDLTYESEQRIKKFQVPILYKPFDVDNIQTTIEKLKNIVSFNGKPEYCCVGLIDIINSTKITEKMSNKKTCQYYGIFLNCMALIIEQFDATVVKNIGDALLFYFPNFISTNKEIFSKVIDCGMAMINARSKINELLSNQGLPEINFRISADYGLIMKADTRISFTTDVFGSPVNISSKINSMAKSNSMVIGHELYQYVKNISNEYEYEEVQACLVDFKENYPIFHVKKKFN